MSDEWRGLRNANHIGLALWFAGFFGLALLRPRGFALAFQEDGWGEWATFLAFAAAAFAFGWTALRTWRLRDSSSSVVGFVLVFLLCVGCVFVAGEEISWGQRLFGLLPAELFLEHNYQQEINAHNLIEAIGVRSDWLTAALALGYGVVLPACAVWGRRAAAHEWSEALPDFEYAGWYAVVALGVAWVPFDLSVEALELLLGLLLAIDASERLLKSASTTSIVRPFAAAVTLFGAIVGLGAATPVVLDHMVYRASPAELAAANVELAALADDLAVPGNLNGIYFRTLNTIHKRIFSAVRQNYARLPDEGRFRRLAIDRDTGEARDRSATRNRFMIDPWGSAYWFAYNKDRQGMVVYSLGPNRRRDTHFASFPRAALEASQMEGDDIGVWLNFAERL
ncbi:MAG: hypothetical protein ACI8TX_002220 [Hyphomicrobiaceae bacterium]|jgi:hypothetical protein